MSSVEDKSIRRADPAHEVAAVATPEAILPTGPAAATVAGPFFPGGLSAHLATVTLAEIAAFEPAKPPFHCEVCGCRAVVADPDDFCLRHRRLVPPAIEATYQRAARALSRAVRLAKASPGGLAGHAAELEAGAAAVLRAWQARVAAVTVRVE